jgi:hypothetical protein
LNNLGALVDWGEELERATALFEESLAVALKASERRGLKHSAGSSVAVPLGNLAQVAEFRGDFAEGRRLAEESLAAARIEENDVSVADALETLAWLAVFERRFDEAARLADEALRIMLGICAPSDADSLLIAAVVHVSRRNREDAARLVGAALALYQRLGAPPLREGTVLSRRFAALEQDIGRERYEPLSAEGAALSTDDVLDLVVRALD